GHVARTRGRRGGRRRPGDPLPFGEDQRAHLAGEAAGRPPGLRPPRLAGDRPIEAGSRSTRRRRLRGPPARTVQGQEAARCQVILLRRNGLRAAAPRSGRGRRRERSRAEGTRGSRECPGEPRAIPGGSAARRRERREGRGASASVISPDPSGSRGGVRVLSPTEGGSSGALGGSCGAVSGEAASGPAARDGGVSRDAGGSAALERAESSAGVSGSPGGSS